MRRNATWVLTLLSAAALAGATGCQTAGLHLLNFIGLKEKPLVVALVLDSGPSAAVQAFNPFPRYAELQKALSSDLGRPVSIDACLLFQAELGLGSGWYHLAVVTPTHYARLKKPEAFRVLAAAVDRQGRAARSAALIVPADSELQNVPDLRGKVVAFGPVDDARTHHAALRLLQDGGLEKTDLSLEVLPLPGSLRHLGDGRAVARAVMSGSADAGFIDQAAWEAFAEHEERGGEPAGDKLRIIARTVALPQRLMIASPELDDVTAGKVRAFLLAVGRQHPEVLKPLDVSGYQVAGDKMLSACRGLMPGEKPKEPQEAEEAETPPAAESGLRL